MHNLSSDKNSTRKKSAQKCCPSEQTFIIVAHVLEGMQESQQCWQMVFLVKTNASSPGLTTGLVVGPFPLRGVEEQAAEGRQPHEGVLAAARPIPVCAGKL